MSNALRKIRKNADNYIIQDVFNNMTPEQYRKGLDYAVNKTKEDLTKEFQRKFNSLENQFNYELSKQAGQIIDTISIELIYELANQMNAFTEEDDDIRNQIIDKVQEIYENTMNQIKKYSKYKNNKQAEKEFKKKKDKILKIFNLKF